MPRDWSVIDELLGKVNQGAEQDAAERWSEGPRPQTAAGLSAAAAALQERWEANVRAISPGDWEAATEHAASGAARVPSLAAKRRQLRRRTIRLNLAYLLAAAAAGGLAGYAAGLLAARHV